MVTPMSDWKLYISTTSESAPGYPLGKVVLHRVVTICHPTFVLRIIRAWRPGPTLLSTERCGVAPSRRPKKTTTVDGLSGSQKETSATSASCFPKNVLPTLAG
eukprot:s648_g7.t1